jgi:hypothetical protein
VSSARFAIRAVGVAAIAAGVCGCVTTQEKNARTILLNQRELASETGLKVPRENPSVRVLGISVVRGAGADALAVRVLNTSRRPLTDLPISIGVWTRAGHRVYLNQAANIGYFDTHVASIGAGGLTTWVYTARALPGAAGRPFAAVGFPRLPRTTGAPHLPLITAAPRGGAVDGALRVAVTNRSGIPQYGLQVYAVAVRGARAIGAARGTIAELDGGEQAAISLRLVGDTAGAQVQTYVLPTIFA